MELQSNREFVFETVKHHGLAREHAVVELHLDREFAREAAEPDGLRLPTHVKGKKLNEEDFEREIKLEMERLGRGLCASIAEFTSPRMPGIANAVSHGTHV